MESNIATFLTADDLKTDELKDWVDGLTEEETKDVLMEVTALLHQKLHVNRKLINALYSSDSEQLRLNLFGTLPDQLVIEMERIQEEAAEEAAEVQPRPRRRHRTNTAINIDGLPVENTDVYPQDADYLSHPEMYRELKSEVQREIVALPARVFVRQFTLHNYVRTDEQENSIFATARVPVQKLIENSYLSPELAAQTIYQKTVLDIPLYRQEQDLERNGVTISRQTLSNWTVSTAEQYLEILYERMHRDLIRKQRLHLDETPLRVLQNASQSGNRMGNIMVARSTWNDPEQMAFYLYTDRKNREAFLELLPADYGGTIICDAAPAHEVFRESTLLYCMAHARREFTDALKNRTDYRQFLKLKTEEERNRYLDEMKNPGLSLLLQAVCLFSRLYAIERKSLELKENAQERLERRRKTSLPVFELLRNLAEKIHIGFPAKSPAWKAAQYFLNHEEGLRVYLEDGDAPIDNNPAERMVKPFVMARKNFLFSNTSRGARATAVCFTILQSAILNGLKPQAYLCYVLDELRTHGMTDEQVSNLLPYSGKLPEELYLYSNPEQKAKS